MQLYKIMHKRNKELCFNITKGEKFMNLCFMRKN